MGLGTTTLLAHTDGSFANSGYGTFVSTVRRYNTTDPSFVTNYAALIPNPKYGSKFMLLSGMPYGGGIQSGYEIISGDGKGMDFQGSWTLDMWCCPIGDFPLEGYCAFHNAFTGSNVGGSFSVRWSGNKAALPDHSNRNRKWYLDVELFGGEVYVQDTVKTPPANDGGSWVHICVQQEYVDSGHVWMRCYIGGRYIGAVNVAADSRDYARQVANPQGLFNIGYDRPWGSGSGAFDGGMDEIEFVKGECIYPITGFTPSGPRTPIVPDVAFLGTQNPLIDKLQNATLWYRLSRTVPNLSATTETPVVSMKYARIL